MQAASDQPQPTISYSPDSAEIICSGNWTIKQIHLIEAAVSKLANQVKALVVINAKAISQVDSAGAVLLFELIEALDKQGKKIKQVELSQEGRTLLELVGKQQESTFSKVKFKKLPNFLYEIGKLSVDKFQEMLNFLSFIGLFSETVLHTFRRWRIPPLKPILATIDEAGYQALPIVALLSFLVGVVITFQIAVQLITYGANVFVVDLSGFIIFREFSPLITAIIAAGRTSTAFTAQIGTMKINEELDALKTMGIPPVERLVLPKAIGLLIALPLLVVWADLFGVLGAVLMSKVKLGIEPLSFINRFQHDIEIKQFWVGMVKVPVFALVIALVGCFQGFQVRESADDVGRKTTKAAVQTIFLVIIIDALFSVFFSIRGI